jgi:CRISPR system Cascade subunit CasD
MSDELGWTTRGRVEKRGGGYSAGTHIRYRHYLADAVYTLGVCVEPEEEPPTLDDLAQALKNPARPLFIGRKCCLPSTPLFLGLTEASSALDALRILPRVERGSSRRPALLSAWWDAEAGSEGVAGARRIAATDERDWANQVHTGRRFIYHGSIDPPAGGHA